MPIGRNNLTRPDWLHWKRFGGNIMAGKMMTLSSDFREFIQSLNDNEALLGLDPQHLEEIGWLSLAESALDFWNEPEEDVYDDLVVAGSKVMRTIDLN